MITVSNNTNGRKVLDIRKKKTEKKKRDHIVKNIDDSDWKEFRKNISEHNSQFPERTVSMRTFFKLLNTYSPLVRSLMTLDPNDSPTQQLGINTALALAPMWAHNIGENLPRIKKEHDIRELKGKYQGKSAIVIGAGGSLYSNASKTPNQLELIAEYADKFDGVILIADRILEDCLKLGIGDFVCVVDGSEKIFDLFFKDNKALEQYNIDWGLPGHTENYMYKWVSDDAKIPIRIMRAIMATSTHPKVVGSWKPTIYFFVPSIPQEILPNATSLMCDFTGNSDINAGGNCGMLAWNMAAFMGCKDIAMVGMDLSYKVKVPLKDTQCYEMYLNALGEEHIQDAYEVGIHPFFKTPYRIDSIYKSFRETALIWIKAFRERGICTTYNCTEGGALHGEGLEYMYLKDFLQSHCK